MGYVSFREGVIGLELVSKFDGFCFFSVKYHGTIHHESIHHSGNMLYTVYHIGSMWWYCFFSSSCSANLRDKLGSFSHSEHIVGVF